jgi:AcrR family transcriptional regulator
MPPLRSVTRRRKPIEVDQSDSAADRLVAALERLLARGDTFTTISVEQLAREAGLVRATFYLHFRNKGELIGLLTRKVEAEIRNAAFESIHKAEDFGEDEFRDFMRDLVEILWRHRPAMRALAEVSAYDQDVARVFHLFMARQAADTRVVMDKLRAGGRLHPLAAPPIAEIFAWAVEHCCGQMLSGEDTKEQRRELADLLTHVVWSALATK